MTPTTSSPLPPPPPSASATPPKRRGRDALLGAAFIVLLIAMFVGFDDSDSAAESGQDAAPAASNVAAADSGRHTVKSNSLACLTPESCQDASSDWYNDERELLAPMLASGQCQVLKKGEEVILVDVEFMEYVVVRRRGDPNKLITSTAAL